MSSKHMGPPDSGALLTRKDVAKRFAVHPNSVKRWQHEGRLRAVVLNCRVVRYESAEVERLIKEGRVGATPGGGQ